MQQRTEGYFKGHDGIELFYQTWLHENPQGTLVITHGISEHSECYNLLAEGIKDIAWDIYAWDLRGHGRSDGKRGLVNDFRDYCKDLSIFLNYVHQQRKNEKAPLCLLGHSMGGLISCRTLIDFPQDHLQALCLSSPAFGISMPIPKIKEKASHLLARWAPQFTLRNEINYSHLSHDEKVLKTYPKDALRHDRISPKLFLGMVESFNYVLNNCHKIELPLLLQASGKDLLVSLKKAEEFYERTSSTKKEKYIYHKSYHEVFNDIEREQVYRDLCDFLLNLNQSIQA